VKIHLILIGSITNSKAHYPEGIRSRYGGGPMYGGFTSLRLGNETTIVTIGADDIVEGIQSLQKKGAKVYHLKRPESNNFSNDYSVSPRLMQMRSYIKKPLTEKEIQSVKLNPNGIVLTPGYRELPSDINKYFKNKIILLDGGGLTRHLNKKKNKNGFYTIEQKNEKKIFDFKNKVNVLKLSSEDIISITFPKKIVSDVEKINYLAENGFPIVIFTRGHNSTLIAQKNKGVLDLPIFPTKVIDSAGAGEAFDVGFLTAYLQTHDIKYSGIFGNAVAHFHVAREEYNYQTIIDFLKSAKI
jgi:sugar/nucleoside kinase (ribokinase family)